MSDEQHLARTPSPADLIDRARRAGRFFRASYEGTDPYSVRLPAAAADELLQGLAAGVRKELCQIVPFLASPRPMEPFSRIISQQLALRDCTVTRMYLVPGGHAGLDEVRRRVAEDHSHQLQAFSVSVPIGGESATVPTGDMWLIDREVVVRQEVGRNGFASWLVSGHPEDVARARLLWEELTARAHSGVPPASARIGPELTATLLKSATMLHSMAPMSCTRSHVDESTCSWYHGAWQYLRLFDMVSSPSWHAEFYIRNLAEAIRVGARRILISGAADYTMLAFVLDAARQAGGGPPADLEVHVLDLCETPLLACRWYARQVDAAVQLRQADMSDPDTVSALGEEYFDVVVADAFLTRFQPGTAEEVIRNWSRLLRPGGRVITSVRLHPENEWPGESDTFDDRHRVTDVVDDFELRLRERAGGWRSMLPIAIEELSALARRYANRMTSHDLGDAVRVREAFVRCGLQPSESDTARVEGELVRTEYLRLAADLPRDERIATS